LEREGIQRAVVSALTTGESLQSDIVGGAISADLLDYLRRIRTSAVCRRLRFANFESFVVHDGRLVMDLEKAAFSGVMRCRNS